MSSCSGRTILKECPRVSFERDILSMAVYTKSTGMIPAHHYLQPTLCIAWPATCTCTWICTWHTIRISFASWRFQRCCVSSVTFTDYTDASSTFRAPSSQDSPTSSASGAPVKTGRSHEYHSRMHATYGSVVQFGPHMVSVSDPRAIPTVYPSRPGFPKVSPIHGLG